MGKFDPTIDLVLIDIPIAYTESGNIISAIGRGSTTSYYVPDEYKGVISELNSIISTFNSVGWSQFREYSSATDCSVVNYSYDFSENAKTYITGSLGSVNTALSSQSLDPSNSNNQLFQHAHDKFTNYYNKLVSVTPDFSSITLSNAVYSNKFHSSEIGDKFKDAGEIVTFIENFITYKVNQETYAKYDNLLQKAFSDDITDQKIDLEFNTNLVKNRYFDTFLAFAGKRIGLSNVAEQSAIRESTKLIKELEVTRKELELKKRELLLRRDEVKSQFLVKTIELAINAYANKTAMELDLIKTNSVYAANISREYSNLIATEYTSKIRAKTDLMAQLISSSFGAYSNIKSNSVNAMDSCIRSIVALVSAYNNFTLSKGTQQLQQYEINLNKKFKTSEFERAGLSYKYDRTLEFLSHVSGVPNTVMRGLSPFERTASYASLGANMFATVGNMFLPFL